MFNIYKKNSRWLDSNRGPLPTELQPLPQNMIFTTWHRSLLPSQPKTEVGRIGLFVLTYPRQYQTQPSRVARSFNKIEAPFIFWIESISSFYLIAFYQLVELFSSYFIIIMRQSLLIQLKRVNFFKLSLPHCNNVTEFVYIAETIQLFQV